MRALVWMCAPRFCGHARDGARECAEVGGGACGAQVTELSRNVTRLVEEGRALGEEERRQREDLRVALEQVRPRLSALPRRSALACCHALLWR